MKRVFLILVLALLLAGTLLAAEAEGAAAHHFDWVAFLARIVNAAILFGGMWFLLRKPVGNFLSHRSQTIRADIEAREAHLKETEQRLAEISGRLDQIAREIAGIKHEAETQGEAEKARLHETAQKESQRLLDLAATEADNRVQTAVREFKGAVADDIIRQFKQEIAASLDGKAHLNLIDDNIARSGDLDERK
jgi:F-type H+-transporting ATPase subunit b